MYLYMLKIGATPKGRLIEQHDIFFGIANEVHELIPHFELAWQEIKDIWHLDAYRKITAVDGYRIEIINKDDNPNYPPNDKHLYFVNLGGYKPNHFEEYHHKLLIIADDIHQATAIAKQSDFYQEFNIANTRATSHIDDKYNVDIDDIYQIDDILPLEFRQKYHIAIRPDTNKSNNTDEMVIGYMPKKLFVK